MASKKQDKNEITTALAHAEKPATPVKLGGLASWLTVKKVASDEQFILASGALKNVKALIDSVEKERKALTAPLLAVKSKLDANAKAVRAPADALEKHIKDLLATYEYEKRLEAIAKAEKAAAKAEKTSPQVAQEIRDQALAAVATPEVGGLSFRRIKKARVDDFMMLVKAVAAGKCSIECLQPNETFLNAMAKASQTDSVFPGVIYYEDTVVASRTS